MTKKKVNAKSSSDDQDLDIITSKNVLIKRLREEANFVKDCFTKFSFWVLGFSCIILGLIARSQPYHEYVGLVSILITILVLSVARIGIYKYGTANRGYGYELFLERVKYFVKIKERIKRKKQRAGNQNMPILVGKKLCVLGELYTQLLIISYMIENY